MESCVHDAIVDGVPAAAAAAAADAAAKTRCTHPVGHVIGAAGQAIASQRPSSDCGFQRDCCSNCRRPATQLQQPGHKDARRSDAMYRTRTGRTCRGGHASWVARTVHDHAGGKQDMFSDDSAAVIRTFTVAARLTRRSFRLPRKRPYDARVAQSASSPRPQVARIIYSLLRCHNAASEQFDIGVTVRRRRRSHKTWRR